MATTDYNDREHEVCDTCGCIVGHGCPDSEPCDCDEPKVVTLDRDAGVGFSATEPVDSSGELPLELDVYGVKGTVYLSQDMWRALGEHAGWPSTAIDLQAIIDAAVLSLPGFNAGGLRVLASHGDERHVLAVVDCRGELHVIVTDLHDSGGRPRMLPLSAAVHLLQNVSDSERWTLENRSP